MALTRFGPLSRNGSPFVTEADADDTFVASTDGVTFTWDGDPVDLGGGVPQATVDTTVATAITTHNAETDPHSAAGYAIMADGGRRIYTRDASPLSEMAEGDIWLGPWGA